ncbi:MAG: phospholipase D-like domain-containing protein [Candidatus Hydrogenedens sp.]
MRRKKSIYGAIYELDYEPIVELIIQKFQQGVDVRLVIERDNSQQEGILRCKSVGISVVEDNNAALMHNKFFIVDNFYVWTGSTNMTYNGLFLNNNNSVLIQSPQLAENYINEFYEMFFEHHYGMKSPRNTKYQRIYIDKDTTLLNMFAPEDGVERRIIEEVQNTNKSIRFMAFSFTSESIANSFVRAKDRGVDIQGVFEKRNAGNIASKDEYLKHAGINVRWDSKPKNMHHKVMIFDEQKVLTGSYNFTDSAEKRNDENVIIIDNHEIARFYIDEFHRIFETGIPVR